MNTRREARERALALCYELDVRGYTAQGVLDELPVPPEVHAIRLLEGVDAHRAELDAAIDAAAEHWRVERMAVVDRNVLRIGAYELRDCPDIPTAVVISEAVELAKRYSTAESGKFVNGVLSELAARLRGPGPGAESAGEPADEGGGSAVAR